MYHLDFFSESPKTFIFQKEANKTKFGGFLFIIYIIIMSFISIAYILDYSYNDKYIVEYTKHLNSSFTGKNRIYNFYPDLNVSFKFNLLTNDYQKVFDEEFKLIYNFVPINQGEFINGKLSNFFLQIYYDCPDEKCEPRYKSKFYYLSIEYDGFELYHQNDTDPPLQMNKDKHFIYRVGFNFDNPSSIHLDWETVKYREENGVPKIFNLMNQDEMVSGYISSSNSVFHKKEEETSFKLIAVVYLQNNEMSTTEYKRKRIGVLDVVSKIGALFSTIRIAFLFIFKYYSNNFNNYKIIQRILEPNYNNKNIDEEKNDKLISPLMKDISDKEEQLIINDNKNDENIEKKENKGDNVNKEIIELPKFSFFNYYFNNFYCKSCHINKQDIINAYNAILFKYFSVENIIYNQIKLENLFKDYHWNNSSLNSIENNELIINLKNLVELYG